jgi:hypothetical protein
MATTVIETVTADEFELHDGEDEAKTVELHTFMRPLIEQKHIYEWEGTGSGIMISLDVYPGDRVQASQDGWIRVVRRARVPA